MHSSFQGFQLLRRDGTDPDGFTHSTWSVWRNKAAFDAWRDSDKPAPKPDATAPPAGAPPQAGGPPAGRPNIFVRPPVATFYEGILMLESEQGV